MNFRGKVLHLVVRKKPTRAHHAALRSIARQYGMIQGYVVNLEEFTIKELASEAWPFSRLHDEDMDRSIINNVVLLAWGGLKENYRVGELGMQAAEASKYACVSLGFTKIGRQPISLLKASSDSVLSPITEKDRRILMKGDLEELNGFETMVDCDEKSQSR